jgi:hypothetical protein
MSKGTFVKSSLLSAIRVLFAIMLGLIIASSAIAQNMGGRLSGRVTDQSGAVIPEAQISARNVSTGVVSQTVSNSSGYFVVQLPVGVYTVTASHTGFQGVARTNVTMTVGGDLSLDFHLRVASTKTQVQVTGRISPLLAPNNASVETTVTNDLVSKIPVEVAGAMRNAQNFLNVTPGYVGNSFSANLNGGDGFDQEVLIDGSDEAPCGFCSGNQAQMIVPSFAVQEFQVIGDNVDAQYGRTSTGAIKYVFKSGTNSLHGDAFEYNRNEAYDSRNFFAVNRGLDRQNEFGFELGGPIQRNKTFFYGYYDGFRYYDTNPAAFYSLLTPAMKAGDFSAPGIPTIYDPATTTLNSQGAYTRQPFPGNVIPAGDISHASGYFASLFPNPNLPGISNNFIGTQYNVNNSDQFLIKIDHSFSDKSQLSASYSWETNPTDTNCTFGVDLCGNFDTDHGDRAIINWDRTFSSDKLNHLLVAYNIWYFFQHYGGQISTTQGSNLNARAGLGGGVATYGEAQITMGPYFVGSGGGPNKIAHSDGEIGDDFTWLRGSHQMQFGGNITRFYTIGLQLQYYPTGQFTFSPDETNLPGNAATGFAAASYLLGNVDSATYGQEPSQAWVMPYYALYAQDKWKIRHNLTLSYGLRWDYNPPITDRQDRIANFDPTLPNPGAGNLLGALEFAGSGPGRSGLAQFASAWYGGVGPRLGIAYALSPRTVFRAAYGLMYDTNSQAAIFLNQQGYYAKTTLSSLNGGVTPAFNWNSGAPLIQLGPYFSPTFANGGSTSYMQPNGARLPTAENYNVGLQKQFGSVVVDASYVGTQSHHMFFGTLDYNQLNPQYLALGSLLDADIGSPAAAAAGITSPYTGFSGTVAQALRPFPQYQGVTLLSDPVGDATYNSLQVRAQQRVSHGLSYLIAYTVSKDLTNAPGFGGAAWVGTAQNYYNLRAEKAVATWDMPQVLTAAYTYQLPIGQGKLLNLSNAVANKILGGWTTSGILTLESGPPISPVTELALPAIGTTLRPNEVAGVPIYGIHARGSFNPATDLYLNPGALTAPPPFTFGDAPPQFPNVRAFGNRVWDFALMKDIPITERFRLTLKGEFFNASNAVDFGPPVADINNPSFGKVTTTASPRTGQLSATVSW